MDNTTDRKRGEQSSTASTQSRRTVKAALNRFYDLLKGTGSVRVLGLEFTSTHLGILLTLFVASMPLWVESQLLLRTIVYILIYSVLTLSMNVVTGWTGQFSMGHAAFYGMGAYTSAILATRLGWSPWAGMAAGGVVAAIGGVVIGVPTLRLAGPFLAVATLAFSEIFRIVVTNWVSLTRGPFGIMGIPRPVIFGHSVARSGDYVWLTLILLLVCASVTRRLIDSRVGRAWVSIREDEYGAQQMGINTTYYKVFAFVYAAFFAGMAGAIFGHYSTFLSPDHFKVTESFTILAMMSLGGLASIPGSILGPAILIGVERAFAFLYNYRLIIYGLVLAVVVIVRPQGILGAIGMGKKVGRKAGAQRAAETRLTLEKEAANGAHVHVSGLVRPTEAELAGRRKILEVENLTKSFGGLKAVDDLSFYVRVGEIVSIIGPNGAGKTTVFNLLTGALKKTEGHMVLDGQSLDDVPTHRRTARGLGRTFQEIRVPGDLTVGNVVLIGQHCRLKTGALGSILRTPKVRKEEAQARKRVQEILGMFGENLLGKRDDLATDLSYADRRRVEIARAVATEPKVLLLDEPCAGMNLEERTEVVRVIGRLRELGYTILLVEHHMGVVMDISDRIYVLNYGKCICEGNPEKVQKDGQVCAAYFGTGGQVQDAE